MVKVNNDLNETNIPCGCTITLRNGRRMAKPYFDFYNYSGLQRSVYLMSVPERSIDDIDLVYHVSGTHADIDYSVKAAGGLSVHLDLEAAETAPHPRQPSGEHPKGKNMTSLVQYRTDQRELGKTGRVKEQH